MGTVHRHHRFHLHCRWWRGCRRVGAAWSISGDLAQISTKVDANADAIRDVREAVRDVREAVRDVRDAVEANSQAIAASNTEPATRKLGVWVDG